ncbi:hypothetical protein C5689_10645 [Methylosinus sporium]|uniref:Uncharacterized protein n=1 Tax=Methylosinus sporium TaxID=428 RepID=A0A2U1SQK1_METSR|nr:hypothetical protein C5689_10645 [Methylosinus sporium]
MELRIFLQERVIPPLPKWDASTIVRTVSQAPCLQILRSEEIGETIASGASHSARSGACGIMMRRSPRDGDDGARGGR